MRYHRAHALLSTVLLTTISSDVLSMTAVDNAEDSDQIELGTRPLLLVEDMDESPLKEKLLSCKHGPFRRTEFSIGHRGAPLYFPEHTRESYVAAAKMGAGIIECDVTLTRDSEFVCRHSQCDLHTTTNILETPLAEKCSIPFQPAIFDSKGKVVTPATAKCCTTDISLSEYKTLQGKMDRADTTATTVEQYMAEARSDSSRGKLLSHAESIELFQSLSVKFIPELKSLTLLQSHDSEFNRAKLAQKMINEYKSAGIPPADVYPQSFNINDILYWLEHEPEYGRQAIYLDGRYRDISFDHSNPSTWQPSMDELASRGVQIIAPPLWMLLTIENGNIVPSLYAKKAKSAGLKIITWTLEHTDSLKSGGGWYYQTLQPVINNDGDKLRVLDVLAKDVGILGIFSDWPATTTYYANCMNID